jgi:xylulokinase
VAKQFILAADFGTSGVKAFVFDTGLTPLADAYADYPTQRPAPGQAEQDPADLWTALSIVFPVAMERAGISPADVAVVGISGNYPSMLPLDEAGAVVAPAQTWMDERGQPYCHEVKRVLAAQSSRVNDGPVEGFHPIPKLLWLKDREPALFDRTATVAQLQSYLVAQLTGQPVVTDRTNASWFHNFNLWDEEWSAGATDALALPMSMFPEVRKPFDVVGTVTKEAGIGAGLAPGTPVIVGTGDAVAAALGAGVAEPGDAYLTTGTGGCVCVVTPEPTFRPGLITEAYVMPGRWLIEGIVKNIGVLLQWYMRELGYAERVGADATNLRAFALMDAAAASSPPGSRGLVCLPYFTGEQSPINDPSSKGVMFGITLDTTRGDIIRALLEGVAYAVAHNLEVIAETGAHISELRVTGGPVGSDLWAQILADVTGVTIARPRITETAPLGVAILAALGIGCIDDLGEARDVVDIDARFEPRESSRKTYEVLYETYKELYQRTKPLYSNLDAIEHGA